jgi:betaine-aldehyde dehydrogenase
VTAVGERRSPAAGVDPKGVAVRPWYGLHIGGQQVPAASGAQAPSLDPATGAAFTTVAQADADDVDHAVRAARAVAAQWRDVPWARRADVLHHVADLLESEVDGWAMLDVLDAGIPLEGMRRDVANAVAYLRYFAGLAGHLHGESVDVGRGGLNASVREPYGVVGRIVPFNHPLQFAAQALAAPLAAGNAVILKPAEQTPVSALHLADAFAGLVPDGVVNVLPGGGATGAALVTHPDVPRIGFTGSVATGRAVLRGAAEEIKAVSLELGGKNPLLILADADPAVAAELALDGMNLQRTAGQSCGSTSRVYVPSAMAEEFTERLVDAVNALRLGQPADPATEIGPLAFEAHRDRVLAAVRDAVAQGARLRTGGGARNDLGDGYFVEPTVLDRVTDDMAIAQVEVFGPVIAVIAYEDEAAAIDAANRLPLGLTANVVTADVGAAIDVAHRLEAGYVWVNGRGQRPFGAPFGGYKQSGLGRENSIDEVLSYTRLKNINVSGHGSRRSTR